MTEYYRSAFILIQFFPGMTRDSDTVFFKERHLVPSKVVQAGLSKFNLMLEMSAPGTMPDPLLIAALIDLVSILSLI